MYVIDLGDCVRLKKRAASLLAAGVLLGSSVVGFSATSASAQPFRCTVPFLDNTSSGVFRLDKTLWIKDGPYSDCDDILFGREGKKFYLWCYVTNSYGNMWYYGREEGLSEPGWVYINNVTYLSGTVRKCPGT